MHRMAATNAAQHKNGGMSVPESNCSAVEAPAASPRSSCQVVHVLEQKMKQTAQKRRRMGRMRGVTVLEMGSRFSTPVPCQLE